MKGFNGAFANALIPMSIVFSLTASRAAGANWEVQTSNSEVSFSVRVLGTPDAHGVPYFSTSMGELVSPGQGYPTIGPPYGMPQTGTRMMPFDLTADRMVIDAGKFGEGRTKMVTVQGPIGGGASLGSTAPSSTSLTSRIMARPTRP